jgi:uncharacterized secreted protein with C-terminal beta-propeller domain
MVQKEIKKKTRIYALIAGLLAVLLVAAIYTISYSTVPISPSNVSPLKTFTSIAELENFLKANANSGVTFSGGPLDYQYYNDIGTANPTSSSFPVPAPEAAPATGAYSINQQSSYSTTNVQVAGVDEADTVKTDGQYLYVISQDYSASSQNNVYVLNANPQDPAVIAKIPFGNNTDLAGMYLSQDGNTLVILGSNYANQIFYPLPIVLPMIPAGSQVPYYLGSSTYGVSTFIYVYNVADKSSPVLTYNYTISGSYFDSRMIGDDVYMVVSEPAELYNGTVVLPTVYNNAVASTIMPTSIYYTDTNDTYFTYTTFVGLNALDISQAPSSMTIMMGGTSNMYVSQNNMYITYPSQDDQDTVIYRIGINGQDLTFQAEGSVPGYIINQYSMDECNGYFRVATTTTSGSWPNQNEQNNLYVLNMNLTIVGSLENMAPGERIYAARFINDTCYLVTSNQTDPFFVIDLRNPQVPRVAGELQIPGYSSYLYPYDENHIIGLGEVNDKLKLALFNVADPNNPIEIANYTVAGNYSFSAALNDPHAFLFNLQMQLLVIPVSITNFEQTPIESNSSAIPVPATGASETPPVVVSPPIIILNTEFWQGAYVFNLNLTSGFILRGTVTNLNATLLDSQGFVNESSTYDFQNDIITRSLYIGNTLYTVSNAEVVLTNLTNMTQVAQVDLN